MAQSIYVKSFPNGLVLVGEEMPWLESVALSLHLPAGCRYDPSERLGLSNMACEMVQRGCGRRSSREFVESLELLGVDHSASVSSSHTTYTASMLSDNLAEALGIYADLVQRPHLPLDQLEDARQVCFHEIRSVDDDFAQKTMQQLRLRHYGQPLGRSAAGLWEHVEQISIDDVTQFFATVYGARDTILAVAGKFDWARLEATVERLFGDWHSQTAERIADEPPYRGYHHLQHDSNQTHIGLACAGVPYNDPRFFLARGAVGVLSDGVSSRLFTEVREKRGLCYTVSAYCHSFLDRGSILCYAGTTTERAQETLDVMSSELSRLAAGIEPAELDRVKARIKSGLIMQQESSGSRSSAIAGDLYYWGRVRTLDELKAIVDGLTAESINEFLASAPPQPLTLVTFGAQQLETNLGVS